MLNLRLQPSVIFNVYIQEHIFIIRECTKCKYKIIRCVIFLVVIMWSNQYEQCSVVTFFFIKGNDNTVTKQNRSTLNWINFSRNTIQYIKIVLEYSRITPKYQISFYQQLFRGVWRYQRGNQNPHIEEEQRTQWPKEKTQTTNNDITLTLTLSLILIYTKN